MIHLDNKTLTLTWEGSYTIKDKELYSEEKPGLYLFTVKTDSFYSVHYIGMTTRGLSSRIVGTGSTTGHLRDYVSGRYYLYNFEEFLFLIHMHRQVLMRFSIIYIMSIFMISFLIMNPLKTILQKSRQKQRN